MRTYFTMLLLAAIVSFLVTPLAQRLAFRIGAVDLPGARKIHGLPTARTGGLAVLLGFCAPWATLYLLDNQVVRIFQQQENVFLTLVACGGAMFVLGFADDLYDLHPALKLAVQAALAVAMYAGGFRVLQLSSPFSAPIDLGAFSLPFTVLWIVGITNATNLLDGMDGLVAGIAAVMALSLAMINILGGNVLVALLTFSLAGAVLGFLPYNFTPARIFLGDSGSLFIGLVMAGISTLSFFKAATATLIVIPVLLFALPLVDTTQVVIGRLRRGQHPFAPDKSHVHHRLMRLGLDQRQAAVFLYVVTLFLGVASIILSWRITTTAFMILALVGVTLAAAFVALARRLARARLAANPDLHADPVSTLPQPGATPDPPPTSRPPPPQGP